MQYRLGTLLIALTLGPPIIALEWWYWKESAFALLVLEVVGVYLILWVLYLILWLLECIYGALCQWLGLKPRSVPADESNEPVPLPSRATHNPTQASP